MLRTAFLTIEKPSADMPEVGTVYVNPCDELKSYLRGNGWAFFGSHWQVMEDQTRSHEQAISDLVHELDRIGGYTTVFRGEIFPLIPSAEGSFKNIIFERGGEFSLFFGESKEIFLEAKKMGEWSDDLKMRLIPKGQILDLLFFAYDWDFEFTSEAKNLANKTLSGFNTDEIPSIIRGLIK